MTSKLQSNKNIMFEIMIYANYNTVINYSLTCKNNRKLINDEYFWKQKAYMILGVLKTEFEKTIYWDMPISSVSQQYLGHAGKRGIVDYGSEKYIQWKKFVKYAIKQDRPDLVEYALDNGFTNLNLILRKSACYGNLEYINKYLYIDYHDGANGALRGGNKDLFDYIKEKAGEEYIWIWRKLLKNSVKSENILLFVYIKSLVPQDYIWDWQELLEACIKIDNQILFDYIIKLVPSYSDIHLTKLVYIAIKYGNKKLYERVLSMDITLKNNLYNIRIPGIHKNNINVETIKNWISLPYSKPDLSWSKLVANSIQISIQLFNYVMSLIPSTIILDWNIIAKGGVKSNNFTYIQKIGPPNYDWQWKNILSQTLKSSSIYMFDIIKQLIPENRLVNMNKLLKSSIMSSNRMSILYILSMNDNDVNWNELIMCSINMNDKSMFITLMHMSEEHDYIKDFNNFAIEAVDMLNIQFFNTIVKLAPPNYNWDIENISYNIKDYEYIFTHVKKILKF